MVSRDHTVGGYLFLRDSLSAIALRFSVAGSGVRAAPESRLSQWSPGILSTFSLFCSCPSQAHCGDCFPAIHPAGSTALGAAVRWLDSLAAPRRRQSALSLA